MKEFLFPLEWVGAEVLVVCHGLAEARCDTIQDDIDPIVLIDVGIDIQSINIIQVFLDRTCLVVITDVVKSSVQLVVIAIVFPSGILDLFLSSLPMPISFLQFQCFTFCMQTNVGEWLLLITDLCYGEIIIYLEDPSMQVFHIASAFCRWWGCTCDHFRMVALILLGEW